MKVHLSIAWIVIAATAVAQGQVVFTITTDSDLSDSTNDFVAIPPGGTARVYVYGQTTTGTQEIGAWNIDVAGSGADVECVYDGSIPAPWDEASSLPAPAITSDAGDTDIGWAMFFGSAVSIGTTPTTFCSFQVDLGTGSDTTICLTGSLFELKDASDADIPYDLETGCQGLGSIPTLALNVITGLVYVNDPVTVTLDVAGLSQAINGVQTFLRYDNLLLQLDSIEPSVDWLEISDVDASGDVTYGVIMTGASTLRDHTVATLNFTAIAAGTTNVIFRPDDPPVIETLLTVAADSSTIRPTLVDSGDIVIIPEPMVRVMLEVEVVVNPVTRDVTFVMTECGSSVDEQTVPVTLDATGSATVNLLVTSIGLQWISAKECHTLRRKAELTFNADNLAEVTLRLLAGDFQTTEVLQDDLINIVDFSILAARWDENIDSNSCTGADATGDGWQDMADFDAIQSNFLELGDAVDGCGAQARTVSRRLTADKKRARLDRVRVSELGIRNAERADLTGDGWVDVEDIRAFAAHHGLVLKPRFEAKLGELEEAAREKDRKWRR